MGWIKKKWKIVTGVITGVILSLLAAFSMMRQSRKQKDVLANANKLHEKENQVNLNAMKDLDEGLTELSSSKDSKIEEINKNFEKDLDKLEKEKDETAKSVKEGGNLGKKLADVIGADFVETND